MGRMLSADIITMTSNNMFVVTELMILGFISYWLYTKRTTDNTHLVLFAWMLVAVGYILRIGYWSVALALHDFEPAFMKCTLDMVICEPTAYNYPPYATEHRWLNIIPAFIVLTGHMIFISFIQGISFWIKYAISAVVVLLSLIAALISSV